MHLSLTRARRTAAISFGVAAVVILGLLTYVTTQRGRHATVWVAHTYEILATLEGTLVRTVDAETGVRGIIARVGGEERRALAARDAEDRRLAIVTAFAVGAETLAIAVCVIVVGLMLAGASRVQEQALDAERAAREEAERANRAKGDL